MWVPGRQNSGYLKRLLARGPGFDLYLLRYPSGSYIAPHTDPVPGRVHLRVNVLLKKPRSGGDFTGEVVYVDRPRVKVFRSDRTHSITPVEGERLVLSLGLAVPCPFSKP